MELITWNTQWCRGIDGRVSPQRIVERARDLADFDVLCLQEIAQGFDGLPGHPGDQPAEIAALLPGFRVFFGAAVDDLVADGTRQRFGNLVATRLPVAHVQHHPLPWPADPGADTMPRMCTVVTLHDPVLGALRVMTTHLEYCSPGRGWRRRAPCANCTPRPAATPGCHHQPRPTMPGRRVRVSIRRRRWCVVTSMRRPRARSEPRCRLRWAQPNAFATPGHLSTAAHRMRRRSVSSITVSKRRPSHSTTCSSAKGWLRGSTPSRSMARHANRTISRSAPGSVSSPAAAAPSGSTRCRTATDRDGSVAKNGHSAP
jgi:hypothetical protein